jgi:hypothetical protein
MRYGDAGSQPKGTVLTVSFTLAGQEFMGGVHSNQPGQRKERSYGADDRLFRWYADPGKPGSESGDGVVRATSSGRDAPAEGVPQERWILSNLG